MSGWSKLCWVTLNLIVGINWIINVLKGNTGLWEALIVLGLIIIVNFTVYTAINQKHLNIDDV